MARPLATHGEAATCKAVNCPHYLNGWKTVVPTVGPQADYIRYKSERHFIEERKDGGLTEFVFLPGQRCFREHKLPLDKQEIFIHRTAGGSRTFQRPQDWTENMNIEVDKIERERR